jgi:hypothetical protein
MAAASSNRARDSGIGIWNGAYSVRDSPRPMPKIARPPESMSSMIIFSATRSGLFHGRSTAPVPSLTRSVRAATFARNTTLSGHMA